MKTMELFAFASAFLTVCSGTSLRLDILHSLALKSIQGQSLSNFATVGSKCNAIRECLDCDTARICMPGANGLEQIATVNCTALYPKTPYCSVENGLCSGSPNAACVPAKEKFICPLEDGIYPDPLTCKSYHICIGRVDTTIACPANNVYDHSQGECKLQRLSSDCVTFNCARLEGQDVVYPKDDRIWGMCASGRAYILGRCRSYERYDTLNKTCVRVCRALGNQPHDAECQKYVRCSESAPGRFQMTEYPCPPNQGFDESILRCSSDAACLKKDKQEESEDVKVTEGGDDGKGKVEAEDDSGDGKLDNGATRNGDEKTVSLLINNSGDNNSEVSNGNDAIDGTVVNGNDNSGNGNSENVGSGSQVRPSLLIVNSAGSNNNNNGVKNGDDNVEGALVNGNGNGIGVSLASFNSGDGNEDNRTVSLLINNSGDNNSKVSNGNDAIDGTVVNGNDNSGNGNAENVGSGSQVRPSLFIVNSAGSNNSNNGVQNGDDNVEGALVNGNGNGINVSSSRGNFNRPRVNGNDNVNGNVIDDSKEKSSDVTFDNIADDLRILGSSLGIQSSIFSSDEEVSEGGDR